MRAIEAHSGVKSASDANVMTWLVILITPFEGSVNGTHRDRATIDAEAARNNCRASMSTSCAHPRRGGDGWLMESEKALIRDSPFQETLVSFSTVFNEAWCGDI